MNLDVLGRETWGRYLERMARVSENAITELLRRVDFRTMDAQTIIDIVYAVATKYGEGTAALSAAWYDALTEAFGLNLSPAEVAATATYAETAKAVNGVLKYSQNPDTLAGAVERLVKMPGVDTTLNNAIRDGAEVAWIPHGDTCAFCLALAANGWQPASSRLLKNGHAAHVHANCDCTYAVRYNKNTQIEGYDPDAYRELYDSAEGRSSREKINSMRRQYYAENREQINEQKRIAYAKRTEGEQ